ncbi:hypothetical protein M427DRAFT_36867 [Gonapodya prolifera JEL478]|uniref:Uncharacterized protein n=1 Tax=Gonapodya prolifera (strain JEL478) TaxID=1344416 RepID=A0A139A1F2_GONPJ|nr:hypothetical protein M427DRAFT_36867 [Gonapodya prolifera JEL478]|eukprot:KXS10620.1 hypothetical protein M427DRAFT_36867 [Gonapodya prolifera JEL478]
MMVSGALCALEVKKVGEAGSKVDQACGELLTRIAAISALLRELDDHRRVYGRTYDTRASKRRRSDESDDEDGNGGGGMGGGESGGAPGLWWRSFTAWISISVSEPAAGGSREVGQEPFDSDIGFFRDDPDEIVASFENAKKWAMEFIRMGGIVGMGLELQRVYCRRTIAPLLISLKAWDGNWPEFGSNVIFELLEDRSSVPSLANSATPTPVETRQYNARHSALNWKSSTNPTPPSTSKSSPTITKSDPPSPHHTTPHYVRILHNLKPLTLSACTARHPTDPSLCELQSFLKDVVGAVRMGDGEREEGCKA